MKKYEGTSLSGLNRIASIFSKPNITRFLCGIDDSECDCTPIAELEAFRGTKGHNYRIHVLSGDCKIYQDIKYAYKYNPEGLTAMIPFYERDYLGETQYLEELDHLSPEAWNNLYNSIIQNKNAIDCFESTLSYVNSSSVGEFINNYFTPIIDAVRSLQGSSIIHEKPFGKILENNLPKISD